MAESDLKHDRPEEQCRKLREALDAARARIGNSDTVFPEPPADSGVVASAYVAHLPGADPGAVAGVGAGGDEDADEVSRIEQELRRLGCD